MTANARHYAVLSVVVGVGTGDDLGRYTIVSRMDGSESVARESSGRLDVPVGSVVVAREGAFTYRPGLTLNVILADAVSGMAGGISPEGRP